VDEKLSTSRNLQLSRRGNAVEVGRLAINRDDLQPPGKAAQMVAGQFEDEKVLKRSVRRNRRAPVAPSKRLF